MGMDLPAGWEGRIYRRTLGYPIAHAGSFALPPHDGDFGSGAIVAMGPTDAFAALLAQFAGPNQDEIRPRPHAARPLERAQHAVGVLAPIGVARVDEQAAVAQAIAVAERRV